LPRNIPSLPFNFSPQTFNSQRGVESLSPYPLIATIQIINLNAPKIITGGDKIPAPDVRENEKAGTGARNRVTPTPSVCWRFFVVSFSFWRLTLGCDPWFPTGDFLVANQGESKEQTRREQKEAPLFILFFSPTLPTFAAWILNLSYDASFAGCNFY